MSEAFQPSTEDFEAAVAAVLARPNPYDEAHAKALEAEQLLNELIDDFDEDETDAAEEFIRDTIEDLDKDTDHVGEEIVVSGLVKIRQLNHKLVEAGGDAIPASAIEEKWEPVDDYVATSLGYFALRDGRNGNQISVYHGARTQRERIAFNIDHGEIFRSGRLYIPVDGTAMAEPAYQKREINHELMRHYLGEELMGAVDQAIMNTESLSDSIRQLGKINLSKCNALGLDESLRLSLIDYVNQTLDIMRGIPYEISGGSFVEYHDEKEGRDKLLSAPREAIIGHIIGVWIGNENSRFRLAATVPFSDGTSREMIYRMNSKLTLKKLPAFTLETTSKLHVK